MKTFWGKHTQAFTQVDAEHFVMVACVDSHSACLSWCRAELSVVVASSRVDAPPPRARPRPLSAVGLALNERQDDSN